MGEILPMLALSPTMAEGVLVKWNKQEGQAVEPGEVLCEVETDKAVMDYEAGSEGKLLKILVPEGGSAAVGEPIAIVGAEGEDIAPLLAEAEAMKQAPKPEKKPEVEQPPTAREAGAAAPQPAPQKVAAPAPAPKAPEAPRAAEAVIASPLARRLADEMGVDIRGVRGSGPGGRIVKRDIEQATERAQAAPQRPARAPRVREVLHEETIPVSGKRRTIAQRLAESMFTAPHYYVTAAVRMDAVLQARAQLNSQREARGEGKVSLNAFLMKLAAMTIVHHPAINSTWGGDTITRHGRVDIGLAVAVEDGLVAPVVRDCVSLGILEIDEEVQALVEKARANRLRPEDFADATFTISNLGSYGVESFTAIINPPGSAILAVGGIERQPVANERDEVEIHSIARMTLSCDHRVIDGAAAATFMKDLKETLADPVKAMY